MTYSERTPELTKEGAQEFLKNFIKTINEQDNRRTASPNFYVIQEPAEEDKEAIRKNIFFTELAAETHLKENHHHYSGDAFVYLDCAWRNPELMQLLCAIGVLTGEPFIRK